MSSNLHADELGMQTPSSSNPTRESGISLIKIFGITASITAIKRLQIDGFASELVGYLIYE